MTRSVAVHALAPALVPCHDPLVASARLIGRDEDLAILRDALVSARAGRPRCVLVTGEAGIGKSRLVSEALAGLDDALVVTGHGADMTTGEIPFGVLADTLRDLTHAAGRDAAHRRERTPWHRCCPGRCRPGHVERVQILSAFLDLLERLCTDRLLVWVVEDLHWADGCHPRPGEPRGADPARAGCWWWRRCGRDDPDRAAEQEPLSRRTSRGWRALPGSTLLPWAGSPRGGADPAPRLSSGRRLPPGAAARIEALSDGVPFVVEELAAARGRPEIATASGVAAGRLAGLSADARRLGGRGRRRRGPPADRSARAGRGRDARRAGRGPGGGGARAGVLTTDHATDAVRLPPRAAPRGRRARAGSRRPAVVAPAVGRGPPGQPRRPGRRPRRARDRRALAPGPRRTPGLGRDGRRAPGRRADLPPGRGGRAVDTDHARPSPPSTDASEVAGFSLSVAMARGAHATSLASLSLNSAYWRAVPLDRLNDAERLAHDLFFAQQGAGKGEIELLLPQEVPTAAADAFEEADPDRPGHRRVGCQRQSDDDRPSRGRGW